MLELTDKPYRVEWDHTEHTELTQQVEPQLTDFQEFHILRTPNRGRTDSAQDRGRASESRPRTNI